jgi:hypothetical protein
MVRFGAKMVESRPPILFDIYSYSSSKYLMHSLEHLRIILPPQIAQKLQPN